MENLQSQDVQVIYYLRLHLKMLPEEFQAEDTG